MRGREGGREGGGRRERRGREVTKTRQLCHKENKTDPRAWERNVYKEDSRGGTSDRK